MIYLIFIGSLLITIAVEGIAILVLFRRKDYFYYSVLCNLLTNPALNLVLMITVKAFGASVYYPVLLLAEVAVVFVEAALYKYLSGLNMKKCIMLSAFLNALSFAAGVLLNNVAFS